MGNKNTSISSKKKKKSTVTNKPILLKNVYPDVPMTKYGPKKFLIVYGVYLVMVIIVIVILYFIIKKQVEDKTCPDGTIITMDGRGCTRIIVTEQYEGIINSNSKCNTGYVFDVGTSKCIKESDEINPNGEQIEEQNIIGCASPEDIFTFVPSNKRDKNPEHPSDRCKLEDTKICIKPCYPGYVMHEQTKKKNNPNERVAPDEYTTYTCKFDENFCNNYKIFKGTDLEDRNTCLFK